MPPDDLRPGELGTLIDFKANPLDVTATIIDLAVRGYLKIEEVEKEWYQFKHDWKLTKLPKEGELKQYERTLYDGLFKDGDEVKLSDLKNTFAERMGKVREQLMDDAMSKGWFARKPGTVKVLYGLLGILVLAGGIALTILLAAETHAALLGVPVIIGGHPAADRGALDAEAHRQGVRGAAPHARVQALHRRVGEAPGRVRRAQEHLLRVPAVRGRVRRDREVGARRSPASATSRPTRRPGTRRAHAFNYAVFSSAIDGFATTSAGTLTSSPPSSGSSGFSGGGFSGGGGGGGGGGSW